MLTGLDSSSALILVHDSEDSNIPFDFSSDDEDDDHSPQFEVRRASVTPLGPPVVFLYLLSPYLKLGALFLPHTSLPLKYGLPSLFAFAGLSAFARQIWYMLAQYMRAADLEDVILDAFARGRGKERHRSILRSTVRVGTGALRVLLATTYLRREFLKHSADFCADCGLRGCSCITSTITQLGTYACSDRIDHSFVCGYIPIVPCTVTSV